MFNFILGFKSLVTKPTKPKLFGLIIPLGLMGFIMLNKNFQNNNPFITLVGFWLLIPAYLWFLGKASKDKTYKPVKTNNQGQNTSNQSDNTEVRTIDRIEKKTTNTVVVTETIYFKGGNYID